MSSHRANSGLAVGVSAALGLSRLVAAFLFEVPPRDASLYGFVTATLILAGLAAALVPAIRAARVDPVVALRAE